MPPHLHLAGGAARRLRAVLPGLVGLAPVVLRAEAAPPPVCGQQHRAPVLLLVHLQDPRPVREGVAEALPRDWPRATPAHQVSMEGGVWQWQKHWHRVFLCPAGANGHPSSLRHSPVTLWGLLGSESWCPRTPPRLPGRRRLSYHSLKPLPGSGIPLGFSVLPRLPLSLSAHQPHQP